MNNPLAKVVDLERMITLVTDSLQDNNAQLVNSPLPMETPVLIDDNNLINDDVDDNSPGVINHSKSKYDDVFSSYAKDSNLLDNNIVKTPSLNTSQLQIIDLSKQTITTKQDDYLEGIDWMSFEASNKSLIEEKFKVITERFNENDYRELSDTIRNCNVDKAGDNPMIGPLSSFGYLKESGYFYDKKREKEMSGTIGNLGNFIECLRTIKGDGNCFYRATIFSFLEHIILSKNSLLLKEIIMNIDNNFTNKQNNTNDDNGLLAILGTIDYNLLIIILILISKALDNDNNDKESMKPLEILIKSFLYCNKFDYSMILYFRYLLYDYITINKTKIYSPEFSVKIGNLLPVDYETINGEFLYDKFFKEDLLQMGSDAEKIIIYLTPYVLKCDLNVIIMYDDLTVSQMHFTSLLKDKPNIDVLYRKSHYSLIYNIIYYNQHIPTIHYYTNNKNEKSISNNITTINQSLILCKIQDIKGICFICNKQYSTQPNIFNLCTPCLSKELTNHIYIAYIQYIKIAKERWFICRWCNFFNLLNSHFEKYHCSIIEHNVLVTHLIQLAGMNLKAILATIKKKICVQCLRKLDPPKQNDPSSLLELKCGCSFCSKDCLKNYIQKYLKEDLDDCKDNTIKKYKVYNSCICGYNLNYADYEYMYTMLEKLKMNTMVKVLKEVIMFNLNLLCMLCLQVIKDKEKKELIELTDEHIEKIYKEKRFVHSLCSECKVLIDKKKSLLDCHLCDTTHTILLPSSSSSSDTNKDKCLIY